MRKHLFTYLIVCFGFSTINAQSFTPITPKSIAQKKINQKLLYAESLFETNLAQALSIIEENLLIAIDERYILEEALAYRILGDFNYSLTNYNLGLSKYLKSLKIYEKEKQSVEVLNLYKKTGETYKALKDYSNALKMYEKALVKARFFKKPSKQIEINYWIAEIYYAQGNYVKAKGKFTKISTETDANFRVDLKIKTLIGCFDPYKTRVIF